MEKDNDGGAGFGALVRDEEVHFRAYVDPGVFEAEMERIFGRTWLFLAHESEVPLPGSFKTDVLPGARPVLITRNAEGRIRAFFNVCRHRGAKLCQEHAGIAARFSCRYHAWTFDSDGALMAVPQGERMHDFDPADFGLIPVPRVESYRGFVFASFSAQGRPLAEHLGRARHYLDMVVDRAPEGRLQAVAPIKYFYAGNWKLQIDNYTDRYHPAILHQTALQVGRQMHPEKYGEYSARRAGYMEKALDGGHFVADYCGSRELWLNAYDPAYVERLAARMDAARARELAELDLHITIYPNLLIHTRTNHYRVIRPVRADYTEVWTYPCRLEGAPGHTNDLLVDYAAAHTSAMGEIQVDDMLAMKWVQDGLSSKALEWVSYRLHGKDERINEHGERESQDASESGSRNHYQEWKRLMA